jgi:predicted transcriptional regulator
MDVTFSLPDELGRKIKALPDGNDLVVTALQMVVERETIAQGLAESSAQGNRGEYVSDEEMNSIWSKWSKHAS